MTSADDTLADPGGVPDGPRPGPGSSRRALARDGSWNALAQLTPVVINIALTPYVISTLGLQEFGLYILLLTVSDFLGSFDGGVYRSAQRYFAVHHGRGDRAAATRLLATLTVGVTGLGALMFTVLFLAARPLLSLFKIPPELVDDGTFLLRTLAVTIAVAVLRQTFMAVLNAHQRFTYTSLVTINQSLLYVVGVVVSLSQGFGLRGIAVTLVVQTAVSAVLLAVPAWRTAERRSLRLLHRAELSDFVRFSSRSQVVGLADLVNLQSQPLLIGAFLSVRLVGLYSSGANFSGQLRRLPMNAIGPAGAVLSRTYGEQGGDAALVEFVRLQRLWVQGVTGWSAVAAGAAWFGVTAWLGDGFGLAGQVAVVLLVAAMLRLWTAMMTVYCQAVGAPEIEARFGVVTLVLNLALSLALVVPFGVLGVVSASVVAQLAGCAYLLRLVRARLGPAVPSFFPEVPAVATVAATVLTVALELLVRPVLPSGAAGLLSAGAAAAPALLLYAVLVVGPRPVLAALATVRARLGAGRRGAAPAAGTELRVPTGARQ